MSTVGNINSATLSNNTSSSNTGLSVLSSADFMKLMITQLSNQDPLNPTDSNQMLGQISQISTLQSNTQMTQSLSSLTLQPSPSRHGGGSFSSGKTVTGVDTDGSNITGIVNGVKVINNKVYLAVTDSNGNTNPMAMDSLTQISNATSDANLVQQGMQTLAAQQSLGNAGALIGKYITATGDGNTTVAGNVTGVALSQGAVYLKLDSGLTVPASSVTSYGNPMVTAIGTSGGMTATP